MSKTALVIGGGLGGMTAAIRLALRGFEVSLFEKNERLGGKAGFVQHGDYVFDTGPSLLTMPHVIRALFSDAGRDIEDYLEFISLDPLCRYFWQDGTTLDASSDAQEMVQELAAISETDAARYVSFLNYSERIYNLTRDVFLQSPIHEYKSIMRSKNLPTLLKLHQIDPLRTMDKGVQRFFSHPKIVQLFNRYATYNGSDPYQTPATLNIIPYVEYRLGGYYIKGGMYTLVRALERLLNELGVHVYYNTGVERILHDGKHATGIEYGGRSLFADIVVSNADVVDTHRRLIDGFPERKRQLDTLEPSLSGMVFLWGVNRKTPELAHHNVLFSDDYQTEFRSISADHRIADDPTVYISIPGKSDPGIDTQDGESWFVLVNMPYTEAGQDWSTWTDATRRSVFQALQRQGIDIESAIEFEQVLTPEDFEKRFGANRGSIYGLSSNSRSSAFKRPANRSRDLDGLYFVGGSTHPGGGIPLVMLSAKIVADLVDSDMQKSMKRSTNVTG